MLALCGLWNLDLFHPIVPPFCVSPSMKNLNAFALEYIEAFYPLILILLTYICIKLMIKTSDRLYCFGNHFTDAFYTLGVRILRHV